MVYAHQFVDVQVVKMIKLNWQSMKYNKYINHAPEKNTN